jgi:hypothetical protein
VGHLTWPKVGVAAVNRLDPLRRYEFAGADVVLRRYLSAEKFADFAATAHLYFSTASKMADAEEGFYTLADQKLREDQLERLRFTPKGMNMARKAWDTVARSNASAVVLSCWTMGPAECSRMWNEYGQTADAVAIETTVHTLQRALRPDFLAVPVRYIDRDTAILPNEHSLEPFFFKGPGFAWENELRFVGEMELGRRLGSARRVPVDVGSLNLRISRPCGHPFHGIADSVSRQGGHRFTLIADSVSA